MAKLVNLLEQQEIKYNTKIERIYDGLPKKDGFFDIVISFRGELKKVYDVKFVNGKPVLESDEPFNVIGYY